MVLMWALQKNYVGIYSCNLISTYFKNQEILCEYTPRLIKELEGVKVKIAAAGFLHSACIDENGRVYIFGDRAVDKMVSP
ncbi:hypothetical protein WN943_023149 [Citrus x changshan-huyou]